jgi:hypothetical protein
MQSAAAQQIGIDAALACHVHWSPQLSRSGYPVSKFRERNRTDPT